jgi:hypothetical protein
MLVALTLRKGGSTDKVGYALNRELLPYVIGVATEASWEALINSSNSYHEGLS